MRILSIGNFGHGWDNSICDEEHIAGALVDLGHRVFRGQREHWSRQAAEYSTTDVRRLVDSGLDEDCKNLDFVLLSQWDGYSLEFINYLRNKTDAPIVYWAFDYQADGQEWHEHLVTEADLYLSKRIADSKYPNWQWLSQDFAPSFLHKPEYNPPAYQDIEVLFTGSYLPWATERNETLKVVDDLFNLVIHSVNEWPGFKDVRPPIMDEGLPALYNRTQVILSIDHTLEAGYHSDRNAQIMCSGFKPLFRYVPLSELTFHDHVEYFYDIDDCIKKIEQMKIYGHNQLDEAGYKYAQDNLKVKSRVQDLLTIVRQYV